MSESVKSITDTITLDNQDKLVQAYKDIIDSCAKTGENRVISNSDAKHAAYLLSVLFKHATQKVQIFTGSLYVGVFGKESLIENAVAFLKGGSDRKIQIAFQEKSFLTTMRDHRLIKAVLASLESDEIQGKIEVYDASDKDKYADLTSHFTVMDGKAFRLEIDHAKKNAIANFGDKKSAVKLTEIFDFIISNSQEVIFSAR
jgi:hypothetical protein